MPVGAKSIFMKLKHVIIKNFKGIREIEIPMETAAHKPRPLTVILGDNGSGKTSILQAIALTLSMATRRTREISSFNWHGFLPERLASFGPTFIELLVLFEPEEILLNNKLFNAWYESLPPERQQMRIMPPSSHPEVTLRFDQARVYSPQGPEATYQFLSRYYIKTLLNTRPEFQAYFAKVGDVFWFDQYRNLGSGNNNRESWQAGVAALRSYLVGWWGFHTSPHRRGKDYIPLLEDLFSKIFPGTKLTGIEPRPGVTIPTVDDFYFLIEREDKVYDLSEMSSGEQAVFPLIYEFVRLDIRRSIVLIDEIELHLHPPEQQRLLATLPKIGADCQFLITTHSEFISNVIPNEQEVRLDRGMRCL